MKVYVGLELTQTHIHSISKGSNLKTLSLDLIAGMYFLTIEVNKEVKNIKFNVIR